MLPILKLVSSPLLSLFIFVLGSGLFTTLLVCRLQLEHASSIVVGAMTGAYYLGVACGSFGVERFIVRVGHIRAFSAFASALAVLSLLHGMIVEPWFWLLLRVISGFVTAGLFVVIESWLLILGHTQIRGQILALYMIVFYAAQASGQFLINLGDPSTLLLFAVGAMLSSLSVIPLAMTRVGQPQISAPSALNLATLFQVAPSGMIGCFSSGLILGAIYGLFPLFFLERLVSKSDMALLMALVIFGGMLLQYPVGKLSDRIERRIILMMISLCSGVIAALMVLCTGKVASAVLMFLLGGMTFTLYPVSISHACDSLDEKDMVSGTQGLLLSYSAGATVGPIFGSVSMFLLGANGLLWYFILISILLVIFFTCRRIYTPARIQEEPFVSLPHTTPITAELDPRGDETS